MPKNEFKKNLIKIFSLFSNGLPQKNVSHFGSAVRLAIANILQIYIYYYIEIFSEHFGLLICGGKLFSLIYSSLKLKDGLGFNKNNNNNNNMMLFQGRINSTCEGGQGKPDGTV